MQTFFINQLRGLIDRGHEVTIFAFRTQQHVPLDLKNYNFDGKIFYRKLPSDKRDYDIVYCTLGAMIKHCFEFKHDDHGLRGKVVAGFHSVIRKYRNLREVDLYLPCCENFKQQLLNKQCDPEKIIVQHMGIDFSRFKFQKRAMSRDGLIRIISVCRLVEIKGLEFAISAVARLLKKYPWIEYNIIGDGVLYNSLQNQIKRLGVEKNIKLLGFKPHDHVAELMDKSHIFLLPSVTARSGQTEGLPTGLQEAMAMGLPVVSTYHSGIPELVEDEINGFLVQERRVTPLIKKLEYLITHPKKWAQMGIEGRKSVEIQHDVHKQNKKLERLFLNLVYQ